MAAWERFEVLRVPSASWTMETPLSVAYITAWAKSLASAMKESPTLSGSTMQLGQVPMSPPLLASALESRASPVPWP